MATVTQEFPQLRGDRHIFSSSDDNATMKQIQATHAPDGREVDEKPLLQVIEGIFKCAEHGIPGSFEVHSFSLILLLYVEVFIYFNMLLTILLLSMSIASTIAF